MKNWKPSDIIILALVFIVTMVVAGVLITRLTTDGGIRNDNLDLILAFAGTIVTGILMYVTKNKE